MGASLDEQDELRQRRQLYEDELMMRRIAQEEERVDAAARQNQHDTANDYNIAESIQAREQWSDRKQLALLQRQRSRQILEDARMAKHLSQSIGGEGGDEVTDEEPPSPSEENCNADGNAFGCYDEAEFEKLKLACRLLRGDAEDEENAVENSSGAKKLRKTLSFGRRRLCRK